MKNIILLFIVLVTSCGTDQGEGTLYKYTVKNESGKDIKVESYLTIYPNVSPIITNLRSGETLTKTYQDGLPPKTYYFANFFGENNAGRDSLKIIYDNDKFDLFIKEFSDNKSNPLNRNIYNDEIETFIFTEQDFENAEDCNGNCD